ncbi:MAG: ATP-binding protein [Chitinophagaceae bacterium]
MRTTVIIYLFIFSLLYSFNSFSQTHLIDSLKKELATQQADTSKIRTLLHLSDAYRFSYPDSALAYAQQALSISEKIQDDGATFWSIVTINSALYVLGNYALELEYAFKALPLGKKLNTPYTIGFSNGMLSDCYYNLGEYHTSLQYWREVVKISENELPGERFRIYANSSRMFEAIHQYDSALIYAKKGYSLFEQDASFNQENDGTKFDRSNIYISLGDAYTGKANYDSALFFYRKSIPLSTAIDLSLNNMDAYSGIAKVYKERNGLDSAIWFAQKAVAEKITKTYPVGLLKIVKLLADIYKTRNIADSTLKYLLMASEIKDSLFSREKTIAFQTILFREQQKKKEVETATLKLQNEYRSYFSIALVVILLVVAAIVIRNRRIKQLQKMRNTIADDLHDDIGSTLSSISIMNELAKAKSPEALSLLTSIGESTTTIQENMSDIVWTIKAGNDRFENVTQRMNQFAEEILDSKNIELDFTVDAPQSAAKLTMEQRKNFYLFFKEVINNTAKHSGAGKVSVCITQKDQYVNMSIRDDGKGFDTSMHFNGNGMSSLKKRAAELNAQFNITSKVNSGTIVQLRFKIT